MRHWSDRIGVGLCVLGWVALCLWAIFDVRAWVGVALGAGLALLAIQPPRVQGQRVVGALGAVLAPTLAAAGLASVWLYGVLSVGGAWMLFWLLSANSRLPQAWVRVNVRLAALYLGVASAALWLLPPIGAALLNGVLLLIVASMAHKAVREPAPVQYFTRAWVMLAALAWLLGLGSPAALTLYAGVAAFAPVRAQLLSVAAAALFLGVANQMAGAWGKRRASAWLPLWCVAGGGLFNAGVLYSVALIDVVGGVPIDGLAALLYAGRGALLAGLLWYGVAWAVRVGRAGEQR